MGAVRPPRRRQPKVVVLGAVVVAVAGAAYVTWRTTGPGGPRGGGREVPVPVTTTDVPPPRFDPPRTEAERVERLVDLLLHGDTDDALWARRRLAEAGEPGRAAAADLARRNIPHGNIPAAAHALDLLLVDPRPEDVTIALEGLDHPAQEIVQRSLILLTKLDGPPVRAALRRIGDVARTSHPGPTWAVDALAVLGGDDAVAELERIATSPEFLPGEQNLALSRLGRAGGERARTILRRELAAASDDERRIAASQALIDLGDEAPRPVLREMWTSGIDPGVRERAMALLCRLDDDAAFAEVSRRLAEPALRPADRAQALGLLGLFPPARRLPVLRRIAAMPLAREVRVDAWEQLVRDGEESDRAAARALLHAEGADGRESRILGALVVTRIPGAATGRALLDAERAARDDDELRKIVLRAIVLAGAEGGAEAVVRAIAADPASAGSGTSLSYELWTVFADAPKAFREACAPWIRRALAGELGTVGPVGLQHLVLLAPLTTDAASAAALVEPFLAHESRHVRSAAAEVLADHSGPTTLAALNTAWWARQDDFTRGTLRQSLERIHLARPVR